MSVDLTNQNQLQQILRDRDISPKRSVGQHFLICPQAISATIATLKGGPKLVTELGAGLGVLTLAMLDAGYTVKAIEKDKLLANALLELTPNEAKPRLELVLADLRKTGWGWRDYQPAEKTTGSSFQIAGNIPYNLSGLIIRRVIDLDPKPYQAVLLVQKEVAGRLCAVAPNMHLISLAVQLWGNARPVLDVPADCFWPPPQVDSQLVVLFPCRHPEYSSAERNKIMTLARPLFQNKRKQIQSALRKKFNLSPEQVESLLRLARIRPDARPQALTVTQWRDLVHVLY